MTLEHDFAELTPFLAVWGLETAHERLGQRMASTMEELEAFHCAIVPRLEEIIQFLNQFPLDDIPEQYRPLAYSALAICEVDNAVNVWRAPVLDNASDPRTWRVKRSYYDYM